MFALLNLVGLLFLLTFLLHCFFLITLFFWSFHASLFLVIIFLILTFIFIRFFRWVSFGCWLSWWALLLWFLEITLRVAFSQLCINTDNFRDNTISKLLALGNSLLFAWKMSVFLLALCHLNSNNFYFEFN